MCTLLLHRECSTAWPSTGCSQRGGGAPAWRGAGGTASCWAHGAALGVSLRDFSSCSVGYEVSCSFSWYSVFLSCCPWENSRYSRIQWHLHHFLNGYFFMLLVVVQSLSPLCDPMDCSMPGFLCPPRTISWSLFKLKSIELVMPSNHLILCQPLLILPSIFPSITSFSNK